MDYATYFSTKYTYISSADLTLLENRAKEILVHLLFPAKKVITQSDKDYAYSEYEYWIASCIQEMIERMGITSVVAYSENGISIRFSASQLSSELRNEVVPFAGI